MVTTRQGKKLASPKVRLYENADEDSFSLHLNEDSIRDRMSSTPLASSSLRPLGFEGLVDGEEDEEHLINSDGREELSSSIVAGNVGEVIDRSIRSRHNLTGGSSKGDSRLSEYSTVSSGSRRDQSRGRSNTEIPCDSGGYNKYIIYATVVLIIFIGLFIVMEEKPHPDESMKKAYMSWGKSFSSLARENEQSREEIMAAASLIGRKWLLDRVSEPLVLLVAGTGSARFVERAAHIASLAVFQKPVLFGANPKTERGPLHRQLFDVMKALEDKPVVAAIQGVDAMSWDAPLVLHAFADDKSFPVKNTLLMLSVESCVECSPSDCDNKLLSHLRHRWIEVGGEEDEIDPILSRIGAYLLCL